MSRAFGDRGDRHDQGDRHEDPLVKVAYAQNLPEAELIQGLLSDRGIPSMVRRAPGFDVADFLAAGPRDVLVPESRAAEARDTLNAR